MTTQIIYSENFESYAVSASLIGTGATKFTARQATPALAVVAGKYGAISGGDWSTASCNDPDLTALTDCVIDFDIKAAAGGRAIFGVHVDADSGIWCQILPSNQMRLFKVTNGNGYDFINATLNLIATLDASVPASFPCHVKVTIAGNVFSIKIDSGATNSVTETSAPSGTFALGTLGAGWQLDNIVVTHEVPEPPVWAINYPAVGTITKNTAAILVKTDITSTAYFVCLAYGSAAPTAAQVKAGTDAADTALAAGLKGTVALTANVAGTINATGLSACTAYAVYCIADGAVLQTTPSSFSFSTLIDNSDYLKRSLLQVETTIEFKLNLGTTLSSATDITKYAVNIGDITEKLSKSSVNSGGVLLPNLTIKLDNHFGKFNRDSGYFKNGFINGSSITITTHYIDSTGAEILPEFVFAGLIKYVSCAWDREKHIFSTTIIPASSLLATEKIAPGTLSHTTFKNICYRILHRAPFTKYMTVSLANFAMGWDVAAIDSYADMTNKKVKDVLDDIMMLTGSIYYVDYSGNFIIEPIIPTSPAAVCTFRGDDIQKISSEKYDWKGQYTAIRWEDGTNAIQRVEMSYPDRELYQYDYVELELKEKYVNDTTNRSTIMANLLAMYKYLKREIVLTCKWSPDVTVNDYVALDVAEESIDSDGFLIWNENQWNDSKFWGIESPGISFSSAELWRVTDIKRDTQGKQMQLTVVQLYSDDEV